MGRNSKKTTKKAKIKKSFRGKNSKGTTKKAKIKKSFRGGPTASCATPQRLANIIL